MLKKINEKLFEKKNEKVMLKILKMEKHLIPGNNQKSNCSKCENVQK